MRDDEVCEAQCRWSLARQSPGVLLYFILFYFLLPRELSAKPLPFVERYARIEAMAKKRGAGSSEDDSGRRKLLKTANATPIAAHLPLALARLHPEEQEKDVQRMDFHTTRHGTRAAHQSPPSLVRPVLSHKPVPCLPHMLCWEGFLSEMRVQNYATSLPRTLSACRLPRGLP